MTPHLSQQTKSFAKSCTQTSRKYFDLIALLNARQHPLNAPELKDLKIRDVQLGKQNSATPHMLGGSLVTLTSIAHVAKTRHKINTLAPEPFDNANIYPNFSTKRLTSLIRCREGFTPKRLSTFTNPLACYRNVMLTIVGDVNHPTVALLTHIITIVSTLEDQSRGLSYMYIDDIIRQYLAR